MKINQAIKKLNEDYETLDRIDGDAVIDPTTAKAKKEAEEGKKNVEKVMKETTPEEIKDPKMPKTKDLKAMGLQEDYYHNYDLYDTINNNKNFLSKKMAEDDNFLFRGNHNYFNVSIYKMLFNKNNFSIYLDFKGDGGNTSVGDDSDKIDLLFSCYPHELDPYNYDEIKKSIKKQVIDRYFFEVQSKVHIEEYGGFITIYTPNEIWTAKFLDIVLQNAELYRDIYNAIYNIQENLVLSDIKTEDLKNMSLQESLNTLLEGYIEDTENHDFLVEYLDNYGDLNRLEVADNNAQSFFNELANMNLVNDFSKIILFEIDDATVYKDQDYDSIVDEYDFDEFTGEFTKKEESLNESSIINPMFNSAEEYSVAAKEWVENEGDFKASITNDNKLNILFPDDTLLGSIDMNELFKKVKEDIEWSFDSDDDVVDLGFGTSDETFWTDLFWEEYDKLVEDAEENFEESLIDKDDDAFLSGGLVLSEDENDWEISSTDNLELFDDNDEYNRKLAEVQMSNFGKVYYWVDTLEPLEVEEVFDYDLEKSLNEDSGQRAVRYFNKQVNGKLDGIERPTLGDYIKALEEE